MKKRSIILDCDPGHDDAIALLMAGRYPGFDLLGVTVESGNQTLEKTGRNALNLCQYLDIDVPVFLGATRPLVKAVDVCEVIHGETGLDGFDFPELKKTYASGHAVEFIIRTLMQSPEPVTLVATGPLTNLALAFRLEPGIEEHIEEVVLMGGAYGSGNVTPAAEFNILTDPEAAHIVFNSGCKVTMVGLDVTRKVLALPEVVQRMSSIHNKASDLFVKLMNVFNANQKKVFGLEGGPLHDPVTIAYLIDPTVLKIQHVHCEIDLSHGSSYGRTNCDVPDYLHLEKNLFLALDIDVDRFWNLVEDSLKRYD